MEIEKMTVTEIEAYLEEKKKVKPRATPGAIELALKANLVAPLGKRFPIIDILMSFDWTPESRAWEKELRLGRSSKHSGWVVFSKENAEGNVWANWEFIPFDAEKLGQVTP